MTLSTAVNGTIKFDYAKTIRGETVTYPKTLTFGQTLATGVTINKADLVYHSFDDAITGSATESLDLAGSLSDIYGDTLTMVKVKLIYFHNKSTTAGDTITLGGNANPFNFLGTAAHTITIGPNGKLLMIEPSLAGKAVTASTGDILDITNDTANANSFDIIIIGTSA